MPKQVTPLTNTQVKNAKPTDKEFTLSDGGGLQLRVRPNGAKLWVVKYTHPITKKRTNIGLGNYPAVSLAAARGTREEIKVLIAKGLDPVSEKANVLKAKSDAIERTFGLYTQKWFELKSTKVKQETAEHAHKIVERHLLNKLATLPITDIKPKVIRPILDSLAAKGSLETVKRLCRFINEIMIIALADNAIEANYMSDVSKLYAAPKRQNMLTIKPEELPELVKAINMANAMRVTKYLAFWQLHTMTRPAEAATARWSEIDEDNGLWIIPAEKMKMNKEHIVPLSQQCLSLLATMKTISGDREFIFPSHRDPNRHSNTQSVNMLLKRNGYKDKLVSHGFRALASTTLNEQGYDAELIEVCLAHVDRNSVRRAYNRADYIQLRRNLMQLWSDFVSKQ